MYTLVFHLQDTDILASPGQVHIEVGQILHLILPLLSHTHILRQDHAAVILLLVEALRQRSNHIGKAACLDKRHALRCHKQYLFHADILQSFPGFSRSVSHIITHLNKYIHS